jgi:hypothetical protein
LTAAEGEREREREREKKGQWVVVEREDGCIQGY